MQTTSPAHAVDYDGSELIPDFTRGFLLHHGAAGENAWRTGIDCVLERDDGARWFLAEGCVRENLWRPRDRPIFTGQPYQARCAVSAETSVLLKFGPARHALFGREAANDGKRATPVSQIHCPSRSARVLDPDTLQADLQAPGGLDSTPILRLDWQDGPHRWSLFAQARYLNFPGPQAQNPAYLQPIVTPVLWPDGDSLSLASLAGAVWPGEAHRIEVALLRPVSVLTVKPKGAAGAVIAKLCRHLGLDRYLLSDEFVERRVVDGRLRFYSA